MPGLPGFDPAECAAPHNIRHVFIFFSKFFGIGTPVRGFDVVMYEFAVTVTRMLNHLAALKLPGISSLLL